MSSAAGASSSGGAGEALVAAPADLAAWPAAPGQPLQRVYQEVNAVKQLLQAPRINKKWVLFRLEVLDAELRVAAAAAEAERRAAAAERQLAEIDRRLAQSQLVNDHLKLQASLCAAVLLRGHRRGRGSGPASARASCGCGPPSVPL